MEANEKAILIKKFRERANLNDNLYFKKKSEKFLDWLQIRSSENLIETLEMYSQDIKSKKEIYQSFNKLHNTRTKLIGQTILEIDKLPFDKSCVIIFETCLSLIRNKIHFVIFYAEGQRSPYIIIYDWYDLQELTEFQRIKAQIKFWKKHVPFGCFNYVDTGMFDDEHYCPIEFRPHWKYGTIFDLIFEWIPEKEEEKCNTLIKI